MNFCHPAFAPYASLIAALGLARALPGLDALTARAEALGAVQARGLPLRFVAPAGRLSARDYETQILATGEVPTRADTWHDVLNALVWLRFPRFKAALNAAHGQALETESGSTRGRRRDAMTVLDESGVWVTSRASELPALLVDRAWQTLFHERRQAVNAAMDFIVVGHALLEKALAPYPSMTGKCLLLDAAPFDPEAAETAAVTALEAVGTPRALAPLPIQGIPGWDATNSDARYYDNADIFRPLAPHGAPPLRN